MYGATKHNFSAPFESLNPAWARKQQRGARRKAPPPPPPLNESHLLGCAVSCQVLEKQLHDNASRCTGLTCGQCGLWSPLEGALAPPLQVLVPHVTPNPDTTWNIYAQEFIPESLPSVSGTMVGSHAFTADDFLQPTVCDIVAKQSINAQSDHLASSSGSVHDPIHCKVSSNLKVTVLSAPDVATATTRYIYPG